MIMIGTACKSLNSTSCRCQADEAVYCHHVENTMRSFTAKAAGTQILPNGIETGGWLRRLNWCNEMNIEAGIFPNTPNRTENDRRKCKPSTTSIETAPEPDPNKTPKLKSDTFKDKSQSAAFAQIFHFVFGSRSIFLEKQLPFDNFIVPQSHTATNANHFAIFLKSIRGNCTDRAWSVRSTWSVWISAAESWCPCPSLALESLT